MSEPRIFQALALGVVLVAGATPLGAQRSFVGKKLPAALTLVDTEGHTFRPSHYEGSVLVMLTGIPW